MISLVLHFYLLLPRLFCNSYFFIYHVLVNTAVCPDPGVPANGQRLHSNFQDGKTVTFSCNRDHDLVGNETIRCNGGVWSSDAPECKGNVHVIKLSKNNCLD